MRFFVKLLVKTSLGTRYFRDTKKDLTLHPGLKLYYYVLGNQNGFENGVNKGLAKKKLKRRSGN